MRVVLFHHLEDPHMIKVARATQRRIEAGNTLSIKIGWGTQGVGGGGRRSPHPGQVSHLMIDIELAGGTEQRSIEGDQDHQRISDGGIELGADEREIEGTGGQDREAHP